jgi:hypothetical protein
MYAMFHNSQFTGDISGWDVDNLRNVLPIFKNCPIPEENKPKFED